MKKRMANLELLRCIAMMMVVTLHFLGKGGLLGTLEEPVSGTGRVAWLLEAFAAVAVNAYMFLSGYFLCVSRMKISRLLTLYVQLWMYSVGVGILGIILGHESVTVDTHYYLMLLFPVSMGHYWYVTAYVFLFFMLPFLTSAIVRMTQKQLKTIMILLVLAFSVVKTVLPVVLEMDEKGYDFLWYIVVFVVAAYARRFGFGFLEKRARGAVLYVAASLIVFAGCMAMNAIYLRTGHFQLILGKFMHYNNIFLLLSAVGLFYAFKNINVSESAGKVIGEIGSCTLGVYLLHENIGVRYAWQNWLGADKVSGIGSLLLYTLLATVVVFAVGIAVELLRKALVNIVTKVLGVLPIWRRWTAFLENLDMVFADNEKE